MNDPPTALVGFGRALRRPVCRLSMNEPPTALVGLYLNTRVSATFSAACYRSAGMTEIL
jgi:hypothetical protein